ncbi:MAG: ABC transporter substrate-binding protein [Anaerolineaceae bacterium]
MYQYQNKNSITKIILFVFMIIFALSACNPKPKETAALKFAVLPVLDSLPIYVAEQEGFFKKHNLDVEIIPVGSGPERDQLLAADQVDGVINEVLTTIMNNRETEKIQIVRFARAATKENALFSILASQKSGITTVDQLKGVEIGISEGTVIAYLTDRLLQKEGFLPEDIVTVAVPKIPDRLALISNGELAAGTMPEPVSSLLVLQGATVVLADSKYPELSHSAISFRSKFISENPDAVRNFLAAIEEAVTAINSNPSKYERTLLDSNILPAVLQGKFEVPPFVTASVPSETQFQDVLLWAQEKGMLTTDVAYDRCVNASFLP